MAEGNGQLTPQEQTERLAVAASVLVDRLQAAAHLGYQYGGLRDVYTALGWPKRLTWDDLYGKYQRQDIAGRIVDLPADATWREGFELRDDDDPDLETPFEAAWKDLEKRLRITAWMQRLDRLAGIGEYAVMYLGVRGQEPAQPLVRTRPGQLVHVTVFPQPNAVLGRIDMDPASERFGLPDTYSLSVAQRSTTSTLDQEARVIGGTTATSGRTVEAHWSRIIHAAESVTESRIYGRPRLQRVYNLLESLLLVVGATGEAYWRNARQRLHANIDPEFAGALTEQQRTEMGDELVKMLHGYQDWIRTSGTDITALMPGIADPRGPVDVILDLLAAATGIPKRILLGSERGELASSQDAKEWAHRVAERQKQHAEPVILRETIDRLIGAGIMPEPKGGEYEIAWPDLTGPNAEDRAKLADQTAAAEAKHAQAKLIGPTLTDNEFRAILRLPAIDIIEQEYPGEDLGLDEPEDPEPGPQPPPGQDDDEDDQQEEDEEDEEEPAAASAPRLNAISIGRLIAAVNAASDEIYRSATADRLFAALFDLTVRTAARFGLAEADPATRATRDFMADYGGARVRDINDTTREQLTRTLTQGMRANESNDLLAARVRKVFREISAGRAKTIAMTEVNRAVSVGTLEGMRQAGVTLKRWVTMRDARVRDLHRPMDGQTVPIGEPFIAPNGEEGMAPGLFQSAEMSINERCLVVAAEPPSNLAAAAAGQVDEAVRRRAVHERSYLAGVRVALREQALAVLREIDR